MKLLEYTGEYGSELGLFVPFVHYLKRMDALKANDIKVLTYDGMAPYYFFLDETEISYKVQKRVWVHPQNRTFLPESIRSDDELFSRPADLQSGMTSGMTSGITSGITCFSPPDYIKAYAVESELRLFLRSLFFGDPASSGDPAGSLVIVQNKYNDEWGQRPLNYMDVPLLDRMMTVLKSKAHRKVVYIRSNDCRLRGYSNDLNEDASCEMQDREMLAERHPEVFTFERCIKACWDSPSEKLANVTFNELKCAVLSLASCTVSTIGGFNYFDAYWPSKHIIYRRDAPAQYDCAFYQNQHDMLCPTPSPIAMVHDADELIAQLTVL